MPRGNSLSAIMLQWPGSSEWFGTTAVGHSLPTLLIPVLVISMLVVLTWRKWNAPCGVGIRKHLPPNPLTTFPILGSLPQLLTTDKPSYKFTEELLAEHGPIILLKSGQRRHVFVGSPDMARECLETNDLTFASRPKTAASRYLSFGEDDLAIAPYGEHWQFLRNIYTQELLSTKKYPLFSKIRSEELSLFVRSIMKQQKGNNPIYVNLSKRIVEISMNMITMMVTGSRSFPYSDILVSNKSFGKAYSEREIKEMRSRGPDWRQYSSEITKLFSSPLLEDAIPPLGFVDKITGRRGKMKRARERLEELYEDLIKDHKEKRRTHPATEADTTFLDALLAMPGPNGQSGLSKETVMGLLQSTVASGSITTSSTIEWAMAHLLKNPFCMKKCVEEMDAVVGLERCVEDSDIPNLPYLRAVVKETFRLTPTGPLLLPHATTARCKIGEFDIPAKATVSFHVWAIGRNSQLWQNPQEFHPDRFLHSDIDVRGQHFELFPFGAGARRCPAIDVSMDMVQFTLARLIQSFTWSFIGDKTHEQLDMTEVPGMTLRKKKPMELNATPRLSPSLF
ncbi:hypothetical protein R1flu_005132 [Riccia fluitans]|uniref:Cytochrome P450 n=1 Tax=Riccia fluitans TaxID=41844 RepID=A0ABD1YSV9_9MARC